MLSRAGIRWVVRMPSPAVGPWSRVGPARLSTARVQRSDQDDQADPPSRGQAPSAAVARLEELMRKVKVSKRPAPPSDQDLGLSQPRPRAERTTARGLDPTLAQAATDVAQHLGQTDRLKVARTESALLKQLKSTQQATRTAEGLQNLMSSLQVEKPEAAEGRSRFSGRESRSPHELTQDQMAFLAKRRSLRRNQRQGDGGDHGYDTEAPPEQPDIPLPNSLFGGARLNIFPPVPAHPDRSHEIQLKTWNACAERELVIMRRRNPRNVLEDMIDLTEREILWQFPIDNEQGINHAELEPFHAHVFLERHLESWCPQAGPIRHFMELVCVGLQKNPYISVARKLDTIEWFKTYIMSESKQETFRLAEEQ